MKIKKLLEKAESFLNSDERSRKEKKKSIKRVLNKLRKYENEINDQLDNESDDEARKLLQKKIALAHAQRKKGLDLLKQLKKAT